MAYQTYVPGQIPYGIDLIGANLDIPFIEKFIVERNPQYRIWNVILSQLGASKQRSGKRKVQAPFVGNTTPTLTIATRSLANGVLTLGWDVPDSTLARVDELLESYTTQTRARVTQSYPGGAKLIYVVSPVSGQTAFTSNDFAIGEQVFFRGIQKNVNDIKVGNERLMIVPDQQFQYIANYQDTFSYTGEEGYTPSFLEDNWNGQKVILEMNELKTIERVYENYVANIYTGQLSTDGNYYYSAGLEQQISQGGGIAIPFSGSLTEAYVQSIIQAAASNGAFADGVVRIVCNTKWKAQFQAIVTQPYILQAGNKNTFGGADVGGIDVSVYQFVGQKWEIMVDPQLNDVSKYRNEAVAYGFSTMPVKTTNKGNIAFASEYYMHNPDIMINRMGGYFTNTGMWNSSPQVRSNSSSTDVRLDKSILLNNPAQSIFMRGI